MNYVYHKIIGSYDSLSFYLLTPWLYGPLRDLAFLNMNAYSSLSTFISHHLITFISNRYFSTSSSHLNLGLSLLLLSSGLILKYFLNCPSLIHSYYMSCSFQSFLFHICYGV